MYFYPTDIYLPDFSKVEGEKWASIACDQFTSEPEYWNNAYKLAQDCPSTLNLMLPEAFLDESDKRTEEIYVNMKKYLSDVLYCHKDSMIYVERTQSDGRVRHGIVGCVDLEDYDYAKGSHTLIRATEGTVIERIPPRVAVRRGADLELPHIMMLIDDPHKTVVEVIKEQKDNYEVAYDFDLMLGGGHITGYYIDSKGIEELNKALGRLTEKDALNEKYGLSDNVLLFAIGDGNHSLAGAKALYEEVKQDIGEEKAKTHPARYAMCEVVNLYDEALEFEPIYRVCFGIDPVSFVNDLKKWSESQTGSFGSCSLVCVYGDNEEHITLKGMTSQLPVGNVQKFLDEYIINHPEIKVDYIHGEDAVKALSENPNTVGIMFTGMKKDELFKTVLNDGALPKKTFSMGHAKDKRYYLECRKIR